MKVRFTAWLSEEERDKVKECADRFGSSENYVVRMAVRQFLGMDSRQGLPTYDIHTTEGVGT